MEATECGAVTFEGCCDGEVLHFCEGGMLCKRNCDSTPHCGWNLDRGFYDCATAGQDDPAGLFPGNCSTGGAEACSGVDGRGCCDGATATWCQGGAIQTLDCSANVTLTACGLVDGVVNCVGADGTAGPVCGVGPGDDGWSGADTGPAPVHMDAVGVPDVSNQPSNCVDMGGLYRVASTDCGIFSDHFGIKQRECVAVMVDLVEGARPVARVTKSGISFEFLDAGKTRSCLAENKIIDGEGAIEGECAWGDDGHCSFRFEPEQAVQEPEPVEETPKKSGSCAVATTGASGTALLALAAMFMLLITRKRYLIG